MVWITIPDTDVDAESPLDVDLLFALRDNLELLWAGRFSTGDAKLTIKTTADTGWILCDDGTIGSGTSGASNRANDDTEDLFTLLWDNISDTYAPVTGGRGGSAASDWAANKKIQVGTVLGRALGIAGAGSGLTSRALGEALGEEDHTLTVAELAAHTHGIDVDLDGAGGGSSVSGDSSAENDDTYSSNSTGSDTAHNTMQPTTFVNLMLRL